MRFYTKRVCISYQNNRIVTDLNLEIPIGKITSLIGSNGSGKSTILKTMCRIMQPEQGSVILDGKAIHEMPTKELARLISILPQNPESPDGLTVEELVGYGRAPHKAGFGRLNAEDRQKISWALNVTGINEYASRTLQQLSGGQRQRAWIAMCIAQDTDIVFLDEPTTFLDVAYQIDIMKLLLRLNREFGKTIVMVVHDLNHAARYSDHIIAIDHGCVVVQGDPWAVITEENLMRIYGVSVDIYTDPRNGRPVCIPYDITNSRDHMGQ